MNLLMKKNNKAVEASQKQVKRGHTGGVQVSRGKGQKVIIKAKCRPCPLLGGKKRKKKNVRCEESKLLETENPREFFSPFSS